MSSSSPADRPTAVPNAAPAEVAAHDQAELLREIADLRAKLGSLPTIEQAKGVLIGRYQLGPDAAFALLCRWSSHTNAKIFVISRLVVEAATQPGATAESGTAEASAAPLERCLSALRDGRLPGPRRVNGLQPPPPRPTELLGPRGPSA